MTTAPITDADLAALDAAVDRMTPGVLRELTPQDALAVALMRKHIDGILARLDAAEAEVERGRLVIEERNEAVIFLNETIDRREQVAEQRIATLEGERDAARAERDAAMRSTRTAAFTDAANLVAAMRSKMRSNAENMGLWEAAEHLRSRGTTGA